MSGAAGVAVALVWVSPVGRCGNVPVRLAENEILYRTDYRYCVTGFTYTGPAATIEWMPTQDTNTWWGTTVFACKGNGRNAFTLGVVSRDNYLKFAAFDAAHSPVPLRDGDIALDTREPTFMKKLTDETWQQKLDRVAWWRHDRFGMFIHFGLYSLPARHEWLKSTARMSEERYQAYFDNFNPDRLDAREWARAAKRAGMRYAVLTAKHHEGFCLFDSKYTDYKVTNTPFGRDVVREYVEAFRAEGLKVGLYYSVIDWHHPAYPIDKTHPRRPASINDPKAMTPEAVAKMNAGRDIAVYRAYVRNQVTELLTQYGKIDIIWYDYTPKSGIPGCGKTRDDWDSAGLLALTRRLQPGILVDNRLDLADWEDGQDFLTPEQCRSEEPPTFAGREWPWETCQTFSGSWGYYRDEKTWKSSFQVLEQLIQTVSCGGNLIMNVGPTGRGELDHRVQERLADYGRWMAANGESIYGCGAAPKDLPRIPNTLYTYNAKSRRLYVHFLCWTTGPVPLPFADRVTYAQFLHDRSEVEIGLDAATGRTHVLKTPLDKPPVEIPVIELTLRP